jgi:hypothetical protein
MITNGMLLSDSTVSVLNTRHLCSFHSSIPRVSTTVIVRLVYGHQITSGEAPYLKITERTGNEAMADRLDALL